MFSIKSNKLIDKRKQRDERRQMRNKHAHKIVLRNSAILIFYFKSEQILGYHNENYFPVYINKLKGPSKICNQF